jgi:hypothetical protein
MKKKIFVNVSNHASDKWSEKQINEAKKLASDGIIDVSFPAIDPTASTDDIIDLVDDFYYQIVYHCNGDTYPNGDPACYDKDEIIVMIQGEMGFTFAMINELEKAGITCVHACSERKSVDLGNGKKSVQFDFIQFRQYV